MHFHRAKWDGLEIRGKMAENLSTPGWQLIFYYTGRQAGIGTKKGSFRQNFA